MAKFDVHRLADGTLVVDCQSDLVDVFDSRFVVPLVRPGSINVPIRRLMPAFDVAGEQRVMATPFASAMAKWALGPAIGSLAAHDLEISMALDVLISGI